MKLPELTRKRLRAGKSVELRLPVRPGKEGAIRRCPVQVDRAYPIENDEGTEMGEFTVLVVVREGDEWLALIHAGSDTLRYPARGGGYTTVPSLAMRRGDVPGPELPAVDAATQEQFSKDAQEANEQKRADQKRVRKLEDTLSKGRKRGTDLKPLREVLDREIDQLSKRVETEAA